MIRCTSRERDLLRPPTVVVVDQHPRDRELFEQSLLEHSWECDLVWLASPQRAFEYFYGNPVSRGAGPAADLIVIDLLPAAPTSAELDGPQLMRLWHSAHRIGKQPLPPIVVFSRSDSQAAIRQAYALGASSYVCKPDDEEEYLAAVQGLLSFWLKLNRHPTARPPTLLTAVLGVVRWQVMEKRQRKRQLSDSRE